MAPNPKVKAAFSAMKAFGISEETVKPVLKKLLKLYDKNWELIEEENYRALLDAIFDDEESKVNEEKRKSSNFDEEDGETQTSQLQRPLKRLRRHQDNNQPIVASASDSTSRLGGAPPMLLLPKVEAEDQEPQPLLQVQKTERNRVKKALVVSGRVDQSHPGSDENQGAELRVRGKGKEKRFRSHEIRIGSRTDMPNQHLSWIVPKDEPITDAVPLSEAPLAVIPPEPSNRRVSSAEKEKVCGTNASTLLLENGKSSEKDDCSLGNVPAFNLEVASSPLGEVKLILSCNSSLGRSGFHMPSLDAVLKLMEEKSLQPYKTLDPDFSVTKLMTDICQCILELGTGPTESRENPKETVPLPGVLNRDGGNKEILTPEDTPCLNDVTNGEETFRITWVNEIDHQSPPPFRYIPQNLIFCKAAVTFSLAQIRDENCCSTCLGDCLSYSSCACANGGKLAYTIKGLLREEFLEECVSMTHEPQKRCHLCKECPIQISNSEALELCKGHEKRNFIKECWRKCWCSKRCNNRVVQRGITCSLQVFMTPERKGWGVRTLEDLPKGAFVCEYVGEILTHKEVEERNAHTINNNAKHGCYQVFLDSSWDSVSPEDNEALCLDSACYGNIARFINHRCFDANLIRIPVEVEMPKHHYYHLAFFTTRKVQALEELTWVGCIFSLLVYYF